MALTLSACACSQAGDVHSLDTCLLYVDTFFSITTLFAFLHFSLPREIFPVFTNQERRNRIRRNRDRKKLAPIGRRLMDTVYPCVSGFWAHTKSDEITSAKIISRYTDFFYGVHFETDFPVAFRPFAAWFFLHVWPACSDSVSFK